MKIIVFLSLLLLPAAIFAQDSGKSVFHSSVMGGINFSDNNGGSFLLEGKVPLLDNLNFKLSLGYSKVYQVKGENVKTYYLDHYFTDNYFTSDYKIEKLEYTVVPISAGLEYYFNRDKISFYGTMEAGYNSYDFEVFRSVKDEKLAGSTFNDLPADYRNKEPEISNDTSLRFAPGIGARYQVSAGIALDLRYIYNFNSNIPDTHQLLFGISI
jgi:opacity protein-like surface antigen